MAAVAEVNDQTFQQEVLEAKLPVLVDFWAPGCPPCAALAPILEKLAADMGAAVKFVKVNAAEARETAGKYRIQAVPTLLLFRGGQIADSMIGFQSEQELRRRLSDAAK